MRLPGFAALPLLVCLLMPLLLHPAPAEAGCSVPPAPASAVSKSDSRQSCPSGYRSSGGACLPGKGARPALEKPPGESCPTGYTGSGDFCLAGMSACHAIRKTGSCPSGYRSSGRSWCLSG